MIAVSAVSPPPPANNPSVISPDSNERNEGRKNRFRFSEGVLLALAPAYAYLLTFQYEKGFTSYFGIPDSFIDITLGNVLTLAGVILGFVWVYFMMLNGIVMFIPSSVGNHPLIKRHVITLGVYSLFVYIPAYIYDTRSMWVFAISSTLLGIFTYFILPLILFMDKRGYLDKLEVAAARMDWANVELDPVTKANVIMFSSGLGDGCYASYFAFDQECRPVLLVTDSVCLIMMRSLKPFAASNNRLQRTCRNGAFIRSNLGEPLKRRLRWY